MLFTRVRGSQLQIPQFIRRPSQCVFMPIMSDASKGPLPIDALLRGDSGQIYSVSEVLAARTKPLPSVYRVSGADGANQVIKDMIKGEFEYQLNLQGGLSSCPNVRTPVDTFRDQRPLSMKMRRHILRAALQDLADIHALVILHTDIKPNNILIDYDEALDSKVNVKSVQIAALKDAVIVPPGKWVRGPLCGNALWRSPESWRPSRQNRASDVFSFGTTMIYAMVNEMVFRIPDSQRNAEDSWRRILFRHISFFGDEEGVNGLLEHIGDENVFHQRLIDLVGTFGPENPRQPLVTWSYLDPDLRDLNGKMTRLDPTRRITAKEALEHPWFVDER